MRELLPPVVFEVNFMHYSTMIIGRCLQQFLLLMQNCEFVIIFQVRTCKKCKIYISFYDRESLKMKGTPSSCFIKNGIMFQAYCDCLTEVPLPKTEYYRIGAKSHEVNKFLQKKSTLVSAFDDKRLIF